jgi:hypothetical protein
MPLRRNQAMAEKSMLVKKLKANNGCTMTLSKHESKGVWTVRTRSNISNGRFVDINIQRINPVIETVDEIVAKQLTYIESVIAAWNKNK